MTYFLAPSCLQLSTFFFLSFPLVSFHTHTFFFLKDLDVQVESSEILS